MIVFAVTKFFFLNYESDTHNFVHSIEACRTRANKRPHEACYVKNKVVINNRRIRDQQVVDANVRILNKSFRTRDNIGEWLGQQVKFACVTVFFEASVLANKSFSTIANHQDYDDDKGKKKFERK